ncbi:MAG: single-stranded-DNA-specific exonuclease RecJ [Pseudomonadota bacterium]|nr:single-stranded-DNA-specific exonuclease RecJ [Pseudomonadota bacterium]
MTSPGDLATADGNNNPEPECLLGVAHSLSGKRWVARAYDDRQSLVLAQRLDMPEVVGRVLAARGIDLETAPAFLAPTLREQLPDPGHLKDMDVAAERLASAVMQGERMAVFGDYDVDGATSSALLVRFLAAVGGRCQIYIPDRIREGYGPNAVALLELKDAGASVVVTVDCGVSAHEPLAVAADAGLDVIVVDHHAAESQLPRAVAVINPNRIDDDSPHGQLAAVGVTFLLIVALNRALRWAGWYDDRPEPDLMQWLDLVALGTVCDVVPLTGVNRAFVVQGLKVMAGRANPGLRALADVARIKEAPSTYHLGFVLGPRVNAGGRVGAANLGARLMSTDDEGEAIELAHRLDGFNLERRKIEEAVLTKAIEQVDAATGSAMALAVGDGWHPGIIGIVASRLKERYSRPAVVVAFDGDVGTGSGRSIRDVDLGATIIAARQAGLLTKGGGHAMAAGFTVERRLLDALRQFLDDRIGARIEETGLTPTLHVDSVLTVGGSTLDLAEQIAFVGPFGTGNPEPRFAIPNVRLSYAVVVGENHVKCTLEGDGGGRLAAISFRSLETELGQALLKADGRPMHVTGRLRVNTWQGRTSVQLTIDDAATPW